MMSEFVSYFIGHTFARALNYATDIIILFLLFIRKH